MLSRIDDSTNTIPPATRNNANNTTIPTPSNATAYVDAITAPITPIQIADAQLNCLRLHEWITSETPYTVSPYTLQQILIPDTNRLVWCSKTPCDGRVWMYVLYPLCRAVFKQVHNLAHPGPNPTLKLVAERYVWDGMNKDVRTWTRACKLCQKAKVSRHTKSNYQTFSPSAKFVNVHIDIVGPLLTSNDIWIIY